MPANSRWDLIDIILFENYENVSALTNCKTIPLQAWAGPEGSRRLRLPDF